MRLAAAISLAAVGLAGTKAATATEPPVTVTVTTTTARLIAGCGVSCWKRHDAQHRRDSLARGRMIARLREAVRTAQSALPWPLGGLLCIHGFEGSWTDPGAPYWGGLQMDGGFMGAYGGWAYRQWGTADRWPAAVQLAVGVRAYFSGRKFGPWPNTRRMCGL